MNKLLLDTSVIIDFLRRPNKQETLLYKLSKVELFSSIITHTELYAGKSIWEQKRSREELEQLFSGINILPLGEEISQVAGGIKAHNHDISLLDCIIAATSIYHDIELVTLNTKDFENIQNLNLFRV